MALNLYGEFRSDHNAYNLLVVISLEVQLANTPYLARILLKRSFSGSYVFPE